MTVEYKTAGSGDIRELKKLWLSCFEDSRGAAELFFERNKNTYHAYAATADGKIVSALYLIDCKLGGENAHYLCGAATLPEYRKRGIMSALIEYSLNDAKSRGDCFSVLLPANAELYRFYSAHGYRTSCAVSVARITREQLENVGEHPCVLPRKMNRSLEFDRNPMREQTSGLRVDTQVRPYKYDFEDLQSGFKKNNFLYWNNNYIRFAIDYYACYGVKTVYSKNALAIFEEENGVCNVFYTIYNNIKELKSLLLSNTEAKYFVIFGKCGEEFFDNSKKEKYGMARALSSKSLPNDIYIGITLD